MSTREIIKIYQQAEKSGTPKYQQVCETLISMIEAGKLKPGDRIPTESWLTKALPVSLGTVQKALNALSSRGILDRRRGSGSFVADRQISVDDLWHFRFIDDSGKGILPVTTQVLGIKRCSEHGPWSDFLGREAFYILVTRKIRVDQSFDCISRFFLSGAQFSDLLTIKSDDLQGTLLRDIIRSRFGRSTERIREQVAAAGFPADVCRRLKLPRNCSGLVCHIMAYSRRNKPLSFQQLFVPPDVSMMETRELKPATAFADVKARV